MSLSASSIVLPELQEIHISPGNDDIFQPAPLPIDSDGFIMAFNIDQPDEILTFFEKHGVVVVKNVLTEEQCARSVDDVWKFLREMFNPEVRHDQPETWSFKWPSFSKLGILGNDRWLYSQACDNRQNPNIYRVFQILFGEHELIVNVTRAGLMRPTKNIFFPSQNQVEDRENWKTVSDWLHLDMNPLTGRTTTYGFEQVAEGHFESSKDPLNAQDKLTNNGMRKRKLQAILALDDCCEEDGGFHAVPGFQHYITTWTKQNQELCFDANQSGDPTTVQIPNDDPIRQYIQRMPIRKGSLLVWDSRLPHGNYPNNSNRMRIIQYLHMAPITDEAVRPYPLKTEDLPIDFQLSELGEKLYGFKPWDSIYARIRFRERRNQRILDEAEYERQLRSTMEDVSKVSTRFDNFLSRFA